MEAAMPFSSRDPGLQNHETPLLKKPESEGKISWIGRLWDWLQILDNPDRFCQVFAGKAVAS